MHAMESFCGKSQLGGQDRDMALMSVSSRSNGRPEYGPCGGNACSCSHFGRIVGGPEGIEVSLWRRTEAIPRVGPTAIKNALMGGPDA
jgi:hypothetical protein